jgi:hypothetical protein
VNPWQATQQIATALRATTWPDSPSEKVFGAVEISAPGMYKRVQESRFPVAIVVPDDEHNDVEVNDKMIARWELFFDAEISQSKMGAASIIGGSRSAGVGSSQGRGVLETEEVARTALGLSGITGGGGIAAEFRLNIRITDGRGVEMIDEEHRVLAERVLILEATCWRDRYYAPVRGLTLTDSGSHSINTRWLDPFSSARWDFLDVMIRYKSGGTPPSSPTDGTLYAKYALGAGPGTVVVALGAGTWSLAAFVEYDEVFQPTSTAGRWSAAVTGTVVVA